MTIFLAGATGVLGRATIRHLRARGHRVIGMVRDHRGERLVRSLGAEPRAADLFSVRSLIQAADGADVVIHAATAIPVKPKPAARDWILNDRIRRDGTQALTEAAARIGARRFIQQGVVWVARPADGAPFFEDSPITAPPLLASAVDCERIALEAGRRRGFSVAVLRGGMFYGPNAAHTLSFAKMLRRRRLPIVGSGDAEWALLHTSDAGSAFAMAAESNLTGIWHVVDDQPVTVGDFLRHFAQRLGAPPPRRVPAWLARMFAGESAVLFMTSPVRTSNSRFRYDYGWSPQYPTYREGLAQITREWRQDVAETQELERLAV